MGDGVLRPLRLVEEPRRLVEGQLATRGVIRCTRLVHIGFGPFGFGNAQAETNANACATAVTGIHPTWTIPQLGYVDPTPAQVRQMRLALTLKGVAP